MSCIIWPLSFFAIEYVLMVSVWREGSARVNDIVRWYSLVTFILSPKEGLGEGGSRQSWQDLICWESIVQQRGQSSIQKGNHDVQSPQHTGLSPLHRFWWNVFDWAIRMFTPSVLQRHIRADNLVISPSYYSYLSRPFFRKTNSF